MSEIGSLHNGIAKAIGKVGSEIRNSETQLDINLDGRLRLEQLLSSEKDLDYSEAVTQFNAEIARLEAAQAAFAIFSQRSLFDFILRKPTQVSNWTVLPSNREQKSWELSVCPSLLGGR